MKEKSWVMTYGGNAFSEELNTEVSLFMYAHNEAEALERYLECIARHPDLIALTEPRICPGGDPEGDLAMLYGDNEDGVSLRKRVIAELDEYGSTVI